MLIIKKLKEKAHLLKMEITAIYLTSKRKDVGILPKIIAMFVVAYAMSPIDLIPDFVPVLGYLDDLILLPLGILLVIKLIPQEIMTLCRIEALSYHENRSTDKWIAAFFIVLIWLFMLSVLIKLFIK